MKTSANPLTVVAVLSVTASLLGILYGMGLAAIVQMPRSEILAALSAQQMATPEVVEGVFALARLGNFYALFNLLELAGLVMLLARRRPGFHFYAAAQVGTAGLFVIAFGFSASIAFVLWNVVWIYVYARLVKSAFAEAPRQVGGDRP